MPNIQPLEIGDNSLPSDAAAIIAAARQGVAPKRLEPGGVYAVPRADGEVKLIELTEPRYLFAAGLLPRWKAGNATLGDAESLVAYAKQQHPDIPTLYADRQNAKVVAVFDHDNGETAHWRVHRATLQLERSKPWTAWLERSGKFSNQEQFAEFLEDRGNDVVSPTAAHLLEVVTSIQAVATAKIEGGIRLQDGQVRLSYVETVEATAGKAGNLTIPETFELGLRPFEGGDIFKVRARLRWRRQTGGLLLGLVLNNPEDVERAAFDSEIKKLKEGMDLPVLYGTPASPRI